MYLTVEKEKILDETHCQNAARKYCADHVTLAVLTRKNEKIEGGVCHSVKDGSEKIRKKPKEENEERQKSVKQSEKEE